MSMQVRGQRLDTKQKTEREGIIVWDQKGLVVLWPDGHCSRFSWTALRQGCPCSECRQQQEKVNLQDRLTDPVNSAKEPIQQIH